MSAFSIPPAGIMAPSSITDFLQPPTVAMRPKTDEGDTFSNVLSEEMLNNSEIKFSAHARSRLASRDIQLDGEDLQKLKEGMERAKEKGAHDSLILVDEVAYVVNVDSKTVITAMNRLDRHDGIFTKIDSAIVMK